MTTQQLTESIAEFDRIDRDAGIIHGCKILQPESKNGRSYLQEAMEDAAPLYEGARVYLDHLPKDAKSVQRSKRDRWGKVVNVQMVEGGLEGDLHYLTKHPMTDSILESVEKFGDTGLSHHADGEVERRKGKTVVTKIHKVRSVDFVEETGTNSNLFEGLEDGPQEHEMSKFKVLTVLSEGVADQSVGQCVARLADSDFDASGIEIELAEGVEGDDRIPAAVGGLVEGIIEEQGLEKGSALIGSLFAAKKAPEGDTSELTQLREQVGELTRERDEAKSAAECSALLEAAGVEVSPVRVGALTAVAPEHRKSLVESWPKKAAGSKKPARSSGVSMHEGAGDDSEIPKEHDLRNALGYAKS